MVYKTKIINAQGKYWKTLSFKSKKEAYSFRRYIRKVAPRVRIIIRRK